MHFTTGVVSGLSQKHDLQFRMCELHSAQALLLVMFS
jgi:hypothetical protein